MCRATYYRAGKNWIGFRWTWDEMTHGGMSGLVKMSIVKIDS